MKSLIVPLVAAMVLAISPAANATGLMTCESGDRAKWQSPVTLEKLLVARRGQILLKKPE